MTVKITSLFDSGAVEVVDASRADDIRLRLRPDNASAFAQWFHFRVSGVGAQACVYTFENASEAAYPDGWRDYHVVASHDGVNWFRVADTQYDGRALRWQHTSVSDSVWFAYFEPYGEARHHAFLGEVVGSGRATCADLGLSLQGRPVTCVTVGDAVVRGTAGAASTNDVAASSVAASGDRASLAPIWIIARQHPGETMAEWFVEGLLRRLLGLGEWAGDPVGRALRAQAVFHIVPNMNPDGAALGNLRTNAAGANLNREWMQPSAERSPEVLSVRDAIAASGVSMFFDIHGDESLPYNFVAGSEMLPDFSDAQRATQDAFIARFKAVSPDFQDVHGYEAGHYSADALTLASKYIGNRYGCLSLTLEMPFKDNANLPDPIVGWNGGRSMALGAAMCLAILQQLRD